MSQPGRLVRPAGRISLLLLTFAVAPALRAGSAEPPLRERLQDFRSAAPASPGTALRDRTAGVGHLRLRFEEGILFPLLTPRGKTLGFFFAGRGRYSYTTEDSADREAFALKMARVAPSLAEGPSGAGDSFRRLLLISASPAFGDLLEAGTQRGTGGRLDHRTESRFRKLWKRLQGEGPGWDHLAAEARENSKAGAWIRIGMEGGRFDTVYTFDTLRDHRESLGIPGRAPGGRRRVRELSLQPVPGESAPQFGALCLRDLQIELDARDRREGTIVSELNLEATRDGVRLASFQLVNNTSISSEPWSSPRNRLRVVRLTDGEGRELAFSHRRHELLVELSKPLSRGDTLRLHVETRGDFFGRSGKDPESAAFALAGFPWYPSPTGWAPDGFTFRLRVRTRKPILPVATGRRRNLEEEDGFDLVSESVVPVRRVAVVAGNFQVREARSGGHGILYYAPDAVPAGSAEMAGELLDSLEELLGPYPYGDLQVVEAPVYGFGAALPGMVLVPGGSFKPRQDFYARYFNRPPARRLAHEIARQWFGQKVFPASPRDAWLSDSVAEYLSNVAFSETIPAARRNAVYRAGLEEWGWEAGGCRNAGSLAVAGLLSPALSGTARFCLLFNRGPRVLEMLRLVVGDPRFFTILRRTLETAPLDLVSAEAFRRNAEEASRADLGWFFRDWIQREGIPRIEVSWEVLPDDGGGALVTGRAVQSPGPEFRTIPLPLELEFPDGRHQTRLMLQDDPVFAFHFRLPERPKRIAVDPDHRTLALYLVHSP